MSLIGRIPQTDANYALYLKTSLQDLLVFLENDPAKALGKGVKDDIAPLYNLARQMASLEEFSTIRDSGVYESPYDPNPFFYRMPVWEVVVSAWDEANQNLPFLPDAKETPEKIKRIGRLIINLISEFLSAAEFTTALESFLLALKRLDGAISEIRVFDERDCDALVHMGNADTLAERFDFPKVFTKLQKFVTLTSSKLQAL